MGIPWKEGVECQSRQQGGESRQLSRKMGRRQLLRQLAEAQNQW